MNYFKSITKTIIEKVQRVVQDQYIQPITQQQLYLLINPKLLSHKQSPNVNKNHYTQNQNQKEQELIQNIDRITLITPERQFKLIGNQYTFELLNYRIKQLKIKHETIKQYMLSNYKKYLQSIESALIVIENIENIKITKQKALQLKNKLIILQNQQLRTKKITKLNIKLKNIKNLLKIYQKIPNIKKMKLFQLKNINLIHLSSLNNSISTIYPNSQQKYIKCIQHIEFYIDQVSSQNLKSLITQISLCFTIKFDNLKYQKAIKNFIISKNTLQYQKLLIRLAQTQIRDKVTQMSKDGDRKYIFVICQKYLNIIINFMKILRWHRYNFGTTHSQIDQKIRARTNSALSNCSQHSEDKHHMINFDLQNSIKINTQQIKTYICDLMDICLKQKIQQVLFSDQIQVQSIYQIINTLHRFYQISYSFSSYLFPQSKKQIKQIIQRKNYKLQQKAIKQFNEALFIQQRNQWNRLPVMRTFRHKNIQRSIDKVTKLLQVDNITSLGSQNYKFLNTQNLQDNQYSVSLEEAQKKQQNYQLNQYRYPSIRLFKSLSSEQIQISLPQFNDPQVIICQSSLTILNYFDQYFCLYVYSPISDIRSDILNKMSFFIEYNIFYIFETFLSASYKRFFQQKFQSIDDKYFQLRTKKNYEYLWPLINNFYKHTNYKQKNLQKNSHNETADQNQNQENKKIHEQKNKNKGFLFIKKQIRQSRIPIESSIKVRVIAAQSLKFIVSYFQYILNKMISFVKDQKFTTKQQNQLNSYIQKCKEFKKCQNEILDLFLTDQVSKTNKIDFVDPILKKIKWHEIQNNKQIIDYGAVIMKNIKQVYDKMRSIGKGQIPLYLVDRIFGFYWKTQITYMIKIFLNQHIASRHKGGKNSKETFEKLVDILYQDVIQFLDERHKTSSSTSISSSKSLSFESFQAGPNSLKGTYIKFKKIIPILLQKQWQKCYQMMCISIKNHQFTYKISMSIMMGGQSYVGLSNQQSQQRQRQIDEYILTNLFK